MGDGRERELERKWRETSAATDGAAWVDEILRRTDYPVVKAIEFNIRLARAIDAIADTAVPDTPVRSLQGPIRSALDQEVTPGDLVSFIRNGDEWRERDAVTPSDDARAQEDLAAARAEMQALRGQVFPELHGLSRIVLRMLVGRRLHNLVDLSLAYRAGSFHRTSGDVKREIGGVLINTLLEGCSVTGCNLPTVEARQPCDGVGRCAYHFSSTIHCAAHDELGTCDRHVDAFDTDAFLNWYQDPRVIGGHLCPAHAHDQGLV